MVALAGDPRQANQAISGVFAAGLSAAKGDVTKAGEAGLEFFKSLNAAGNFVPVIGKAAPFAQGTTPIVAAWDYNAMSWGESLKGNPPYQVVVPASGVVAGVYVQAISAFAPHPNAAKLWMEYLYSDEGQIEWLKGFCHRSASTPWQRPARSRLICSQSCRRQKPTRRLSSRRSKNRPPTRRRSPRAGTRSSAPTSSKANHSHTASPDTGEPTRSGPQRAQERKDRGPHGCNATAPEQTHDYRLARHSALRHFLGHVSDRADRLFDQGAFVDPNGNLTLKNLVDLFQPSILAAYIISIKVSAASAIGGAIIGFALAAAISLGGLPSWLRSAVLTFCGVASNFAGVPLAFAFLATLGRLGLVTILLRDVFGFNLYGAGFNLLSFLGLTLTYMYFQIRSWC